MALKNVLVNVLAILIILFANIAAHTSVSKHYDNSKTMEANDNSQRSLRTSPRLIKRSVRDNFTSTSTTASLNYRREKKWQVGRVSRKQFEIVNMLWRKTNVFVDVENTSIKNRLSDTSKKNATLNKKYQPITANPQKNKFSISRPVLPPMTASYIEFYYLDETDELIHPKESKPVVPERKSLGIGKTEKGHLGDYTLSVLRLPMFAFHVNDPIYKRPTRTSSPIINSNVNFNEQANIRKSPLITRDKNISILSHLFLINNPNPSMAESHPNQNFGTENVLKASANEKFSDYETCPATTLSPDHITEVIFDVQSAKKEVNTIPTKIKLTGAITVNTPLSQHVESTTFYDKIKFFEIYDTRTLPNIMNDDRLFHDDHDGNSANEINSNQKIMLEHVDHDIRNQDDVPHKMRYAKKHIEAIETKAEEVRAAYEKNYTNYNLNVTEKVNNSKTTLGDTTPTLQTPEFIFDKNLNTDIFTNISRHPPWSEYPFAAVYVYDRSQIHCDAAALSPHWLIAAASCLSRHRDNPEGDRSAFVTYCSDNWWNPERIAYVKYTLVHPRYHPRDRIRRHLYNIGVIQIVTSMASACASWAPISIMSHHFAADGEGVTASAVGWGLDRYNTNYDSSDLPKKHLTVFEGMVYSDSCPGNSDFRKAKQSNEEGINNVYCLTLPPYSGEDNDAVHGGLLLVGGKLVALYLQEERRQWGDQSAQYTGVWRLFPWVHGVAIEPEGNDFFL